MQQLKESLINKIDIKIDKKIFITEYIDNYVKLLPNIDAIPNMTSNQPRKPKRLNIEPIDDYND